MSTASKATPKVAREVAESEFLRICDAFRIEHDTSALPADELEEWKDLTEPIIRNIMRGIIIVDDEGKPTYTPPGAAAGVTFHFPTGATLTALETYPREKQIANMMAAIAEMTHTDRSDFGKMRAADVQACCRLGKLFLADR
jgi:hypothetical protein